MLNRRFFLKWMHWLTAGTILYFFLVEPSENRTDPGGALSTHAGMGVLLAFVTALWLSMYLRRGLAGRPGPKLPKWANRFHAFSHKLIQYGVPVIVASGAFAGLAAPFVIRAFGSYQINFGFGSKGIHEFSQEVHEVVFNGLLILIVAHIAFHLWRHLVLKDNALRVMVPKFLHKHL